VWVGRINSYWIPGTWLPFLMLMLAMALAAWKAPRTPAGFASAVGLVFLAFFAFNKQAFCNYYFFTIGAFCCAIAAEPMATRFAQRTSTPAASVRAGA
jgi:hypothetical protein